jgi:hypothetical protein
LGASTLLIVKIKPLVEVTTKAGIKEPETLLAGINLSTKNA